MNDTESVITKTEAKLWCTICECAITGNQPKNIKQHIKSITHKKAVKTGDSSSNSKKTKSEDDISDEFQVHQLNFTH
jgi:hypothetical protein